MGREGAQEEMNLLKWVARDYLKMHLPGVKKLNARAQGLKGNHRTWSLLTQVALNCQVGTAATELLELERKMFCSLSLISQRGRGTAQELGERAWQPPLPSWPGLCILRPGVWSWM